MSPEIFFFSFLLSIKDIRKLDQRRENKKRESSNWIPPCRRLCWKQEPKGVITYTPKSDMTIHLGVVAGAEGERWGAPLDSLTPHCQLGLAGSYFPLCLRLRHTADKNIHNSRQAAPRGVGFRFLLSFHSENLSSASAAPKCAVTAMGRRPQRRNFTRFKDRP